MGVGIRSGVDRVGCSRSLRVAVSNLTLFSYSLQFFLPVSYLKGYIIFQVHDNII